MTTTSMPSAAAAFCYVVVSPFLTYGKGDVIRDPATIAVVEKNYLPHVVRIRASH